MSAAHNLEDEFWKKRAALPSYKVGRAAQFVNLSPSTLSRWQNLAYVIPNRERGKGLSYLQLIEAAVVAQMRKSKIKLADIRSARAFLAQKLGATEFPFATHKFKTDGVDLLMEFDDVFQEGNGKGKSVIANRGGQLVWADMLANTIKQFHYEDNLVVNWNVGGIDKHIIIDPRIGFGAPTVNGIPTETIYSRWQAGNDSDEMSYDFGLTKDLIIEAVNFEGRLHNKTFKGYFE